MRRLGATRGRAARWPGRPTLWNPARIGATLLAAAILALPAGVSAQGGAAEDEPAPLVGDRPDFTESALVVTRLQLESGYTYEEAGPSEVHTVGELLARIPATSRLEVRVGVPSWTREQTGGLADARSGLTDASLGFKLGLRDPGADGSGPALGLLAGTNLPTGEVGSDHLEPEALFAAETDLSERVSVGTNVGAASAEEDGERHAELFASVALGLAVTDAVGAYLETYGFAPTRSGPASSSVVNGGFTWLAGPHLQLDARVGTGLSGPSPDVIVGTGVIWRP